MSRPSEPVETTCRSFCDLGVAHLHDRALAELLFDLGEGGGERLAFLVVHGLVERGHVVSLRSIARRAAGRLSQRCGESCHRTIVRRKSSVRPRPTRATSTARDRHDALHSMQRPFTTRRTHPRVAQRRSVPRARCRRLRAHCRAIAGEMQRARPARRVLGARRRSTPCRPACPALPPPGPAMPVIAPRRRAALRASAPSAIARATGSETAPCARAAPVGTPSQLPLRLVRCT